MHGTIAKIESLISLNRMMEEQIIKDQERHQNMANMMTLLDTLAKNIIEFEALYNKEVNFLANQGEITQSWEAIKDEIERGER